MGPPPPSLASSPRLLACSPRFSAPICPQGCSGWLMLIALLSCTALKACSSLLIWDVCTDLSTGQDKANAGRDRPLAAGAISRVAHSITQPPANVDLQPPSYMAAWGWVWAIGLLGYPPPCRVPPILLSVCTPSPSQVGTVAAPESVTTTVPASHGVNNAAKNMDVTSITESATV